jgi:hypothetical protein
MTSARHAPIWIVEYVIGLGIRALILSQMDDLIFSFSVQLDQR